MKAFGSLDEIYGDLASVARLKLAAGAGTLGARLSEHRESAYLARRLTRISCDLSLGVAPLGLKRGGPDMPALTDFYDELNFWSVPAPPGRASRAAARGLKWPPRTR